MGERILSARQKAIKKHNARTDIKPLNIYIGSLVLVRRTQAGVHKIQPIWVGPRRVVEINSEWIYTVE